MKKQIFISVFIIFSFSCVKEKKAPCGSVSIATDWGDLPISAGMIFIFYPEPEGTPIQIDTQADRCSYRLPEGKYKVLLFNNDTRNILFKHLDKYELAEASVAPVAKSPQTLGQPDMLYGCSIDEITVDAQNPIQSQVKIKSYVKKIVANINLSQDGDIKNVSARLKGIAQSISLSDGRPITTETIADVEMQSNIQTDGNVSISCTTFGPTPVTADTPPEQPPQTAVEIDATYKDDTQRTVTADISEVIKQITDNNSKNEATIELKDMGLAAIVTSWKLGTASASINK